MNYNKRKERECCKMKKIVVDLYELTKEQADKEPWLYEHRAVVYNYNTKEIEDIGIRPQNVGLLKIGDIVEF